VLIHLHTSDLPTGKRKVGQLIPLLDREPGLVYSQEYSTLGSNVRCSVPGVPAASMKRVLVMRCCVLYFASPCLPAWQFDIAATAVAVSSLIEAMQQAASLNEEGQLIPKRMLQERARQRMLARMRGRFRPGSGLGFT
jgi:hypothetical protein